MSRRGSGPRWHHIGVEVKEIRRIILRFHLFEPREIAAIVAVDLGLGPLGEVRVRGEIWQERCDEGADAGVAVRIVGLDGLTLIVEPVLQA